MDEKGSTFEDIVDAYLAFLQVSFHNKQQVYPSPFWSLILI